MGQNIRALVPESVFPMNIQGCFPLGLTGLISCCPKDSQESSPAPQFKSIISSVLRLLYGPTLTSAHDYWKNHNFDYTDHCWQSDETLYLLNDNFPSLPPPAPENQHFTFLSLSV